MIHIIVAMAKNRVIGRNGRIPWDIPEDREHFKTLTMGHIMVMGRRTFEEIGVALPGRITYVVSGTADFTGENLYTVSSIEEVLQKKKGKEIFICGGARMYEEALAYADRMHITQIYEEYEGDTYFPDYPAERWIESGREDKEKYSFIELEVRS